MARTRPLTRWVAATLVVACAMCATGALALGAGAAPTATAPVPPPSYYGASVEPIFEKGFVAPSGWNALIADMSSDSFQVARTDALWCVGGAERPGQRRPHVHLESAEPIRRTRWTTSSSLLAVQRPADARRAGHRPVVGRRRRRRDDPGARRRLRRLRRGVRRALRRRWHVLGPASRRCPTCRCSSSRSGTRRTTTNFWTGKADPAEYVKVLKPLYAAVHGVDPSAQVLASIGWPSAAAYVTRALPGWREGLDRRDRLPPLRP